jgi:hypothetical protein
MTLAMPFISFGGASIRVVQAAPAVAFDSGDGSEDNPYVVSTEEQLNAVRNNLSAYYIQSDNIDLYSCGNWTPIGDTDTPFTGYYDGNGYTITNLNINNETVVYVGLFGYCENSTILNVNLENLSLKVDQKNVDYSSAVNNYLIIGGIAGHAQNVINCNVDGTISVVNCHGATVGGIVGSGSSLSGCNIIGCTNYANINVYPDDGGVACGGIGGNLSALDNIIGCENYGNISATAGPSVSCGGICATGGTIERCANWGDIYGKTLIHTVYGTCNAGGISGDNAYEISNSVNYGDIESYSLYDASAYSGGIAGYSYVGYNRKIQNCINVSEKIVSKGQKKENDIYVETDSHANRITGGITYRNFVNPISECYSVESALVNGSRPGDNIGQSAVNGESLYVIEAEAKAKEVLKNQINHQIITIDQVWGFSNLDIAGLELKHYKKFFIPGYANWLFERDDGTAGLCAGMVTSVISISGYNSPPATSFLLEDGSYAQKLHDVKSIDSTSEASFLASTTAADYVRYAYVYQKTPITSAEKLANKNNLQKLYKAIKTAVTSGNNYIEISIRGKFYKENSNGELVEENAGHLLLAVGLGTDNDALTEVYVYDCNRPEEMQILNLYRKNGKIIAWSYNPDYLSWGSWKQYAEISYTTSGNDFARDMFSDGLNAAALCSYNILVSIKRKSATVQINGNSYNLGDYGIGDENILQVQDDSVVLQQEGGGTSESGLYWIKAENEISFQNSSEDNCIAASIGDKDVIVDIPENATLQLNVSDSKKSYANLSGLNNKKYAIEYVFYENDNEKTVKISGNASDSICTSEVEEKIEVLGSDKFDIEIIIDGKTYEEKNIDSDGKNILIEQVTDDGVLVSKDTNGDGVYDAVLLDSRTSNSNSSESTNGTFDKEESGTGEGSDSGENTDSPSGGNDSNAATGNLSAEIVGGEAGGVSDGTISENTVHNIGGIVGIGEIPSTTDALNEISGESNSESAQENVTINGNVAYSKNLTTSAKGTILQSGKNTYKVTKEGKEVAFTGTTSTAKTLNIKSTVKIDGITYKVTSISASALKGNKNISKVVISSNITKIGKAAFYGCSNLKTIKFGSNLKSVGKNAFKGIKATAKFKVPSKKMSAYKKLLKGKGQGNKVKIVKYSS